MGYMPEPRRGTTADLTADAIMPGGGIGDPLPQAHDIVGIPTWLDFLACRCGVIARADHERQAWVGEGNHVRAFGPFESEPRFYPDRPVAEADAPAPAYRPRVVRAAAAQVMAELGIVPPDEPQADQEPARTPQASPEPPQAVGTPDDPVGAVAARKRAARDARNRSDRERRLRARQAAERADPGRRWTGFRPKL